MTVYHSYRSLQHTEALTKSLMVWIVEILCCWGFLPPYSLFFFNSFLRIKESEINLWSWAGEIKIKEFKHDEIHFSSFQWHKWPLTLRFYQGREIHFSLLPFEYDALKSNWINSDRANNSGMCNLTTKRGTLGFCLVVFGFCFFLFVIFHYIGMSKNHKMFILSPDIETFAQMKRNSDWIIPRSGFQIQIQPKKCDTLQVTSFLIFLLKEQLFLFLYVEKLLLFNRCVVYSIIFRPAVPWWPGRPGTSWAPSLPHPFCDFVI